MGTTITAVIIAKNSEHIIDRCVRALAFCDRIIVGENNSTDATFKIAQQAGADVKTVTWQGYGKTKNQLIDEIQSGWVLSIDADEVVTPELADAICKTIQEEKSSIAYYIRRRNYFLGKEITRCGWQSDWQLRLFQAGTARFEEKHVHEALITDQKKSYLQSPLEHYSYATLEDYLARLNHYTSLAAQDRYERKKRVTAMRILFDPVWTFIKMYGFKQGWRDGFAGLVLCVLSGLNTLVKHAKHWELIRKRSAKAMELS